jgi:superkiller protein 3
MGVVYGCFDHETKLPRALKTVRARYANDKQVLLLFESEAFVWVSLEKHPYIVRAYRVERFNNLPYVITEYVCGPEGMEGDLRGWLGHPRLTVPVAVTMALQIAQGMQHAVRKMPGLVHRDLKPANILVNSEAKAMVTDFGLVQAGQSDAGTPAYMSPEQWRGEDLDMRSDIYAYGCILFEMFTAHRLFPAVTEKDWETAHLETLPVALASSVNELPLDIDQFVCRCLEKEREARPQTWDEIVVFFAEWYHRLTGKAVIFDFSTLTLDNYELFDAGYSLANLNRNEDANKTYDRALAINPIDCAALNNKGCVLKNLGRYDESLEAFDRILVIDPRDYFALINKGAALNNLNRNEEAINAYDQALAIEPNDSAALFNKANALDDLNRCEEAIQTFDRALLVEANLTVAWINKGIVLRKLNRCAEAVTAYDQALAIEPNNLDAWVSKGNALISLNCYKEAVLAYDNALLIDPINSTVWLNKGNALNSLKCYEEAVFAFDQALVIDPKYLDGWIRKGFALNSLRRFEMAIQAFIRALKIDPSVSFVWRSLGHALENLKRFEEANHAFYRAIKINTHDVEAWLSKCRVLHELNRYEEAIAAYEKVLKLDPNNLTAKNGKLIAIDSLIKSNSRPA